MEYCGNKESRYVCKGIGIEGELGQLGSKNDEKWAEYTQTDAAIRFVNETCIYALAIMVGTAHGRYAKSPELAISRIRGIHTRQRLTLCYTAAHECLMTGLKWQ